MRLVLIEVVHFEGYSNTSTINSRVQTTKFILCFEQSVLNIERVSDVSRNKYTVVTINRSSNSSSL